MLQDKEFVCVRYCIKRECRSKAMRIVSTYLPDVDPDRPEEPDIISHDDNVTEIGFPRKKYFVIDNPIDREIFVVRDDGGEIYSLIEKAKNNNNNDIQFLDNLTKSIKKEYKLKEELNVS